MKSIKKFFKRNHKQRGHGVGLWEDAPEASSYANTVPKDSIKQMAPSPLLEMKTEAPPTPRKAKFPPRSQPTQQSSTVESLGATQPPTDGPESNMPASSPVPRQPSSLYPSLRSSGDRGETGRNKGATESIRKGSPSVRFVTGETTDDHGRGDGSQANKLGEAYDAIPILEQTKLPRGGISIETKAIGRIQVSLTRTGSSHVLTLMAIVSNRRLLDSLGSLQKPSRTA